MNYKKIIKENENDFNDSDTLQDFITSYTEENATDISGLEDDINEYADGQVPIYYGDIAKEWQEIGECHEMTIEHIGEYDTAGGIYKMMQQDLFFYYQTKLSEDYQKLLDLMNK